MKFGFLLLPMLLACALSAHAQYDINTSVYGDFTGSTSGSGLTQKQTSSVGLLIGLRHYSSPLFGWEANYSYNPARQNYGGTGYGFLSAQQHAGTVDYVVSMPMTPTLRPFALVGGGAFFFIPNNGVALATSVRPTVNFGFGADVALLPHIGVRVQYRGYFYRAPDFEQPAYSTNSYTLTSEPTAGLYFKF
jgi:opacity protein-like surface antigen